MINTLRRMAALWASMVVDPVRRGHRRPIRKPRPMHNAAPSDPNAARTTRPIAPASRRAARRRCSACSKTCRASLRAARQRCVPSKPRRRPKPSQLRPRPKRSQRQPRRPSRPRPPQRPSRPLRPAAPPAASNPPPAAKAAAGTATKKPSSAQVSAIRSACRTDYQQHCAGVPTGGAAALSCLEKNKAKPLGKLSESGQRGRWRRQNACGRRCCCGAGGWWRSDGCGNNRRSRSAPAAAPALVLRPMRPREVIFVLRSACGADVRSLCGDVPAGGGRIIECLATQAASLSPACADVLRPFAAQ